MAATKRCKHCGHPKGRHIRHNDGRVTTCKHYYYVDMNGAEHEQSGRWERDADGQWQRMGVWPDARRYTCQCPGFEEDKPTSWYWKYDPKTDDYTKVWV